MYICLIDVIDCSNRIVSPLSMCYCVCLLLSHFAILGEAICIYKEIQHWRKNVYGSVHRLTR